MKAAATTIALLLLCACAVAPPVQEMSDARQAVAAAHEAEAEQYAPDEVADADRLLERATEMLEQGSYSQARYYATKAKDAARRARDKAFAVKSQ